MTLGRVLHAILGLGLATIQPAWAQQAVAPQTSGQQATADYEDRLIDGGTLTQLRQEGEDTVYDSDGLPRYFRAEAITSNINQAGMKTHENGFRLSGRIDTPDFGAFTLDGTIRLDPDSSIFSLSQRGMPFDHAWLANNSVGNVYTPAIDLSRNQYRFYIPTFPVRGATTEWLHDGDLQLQASVGQPGIFDGLRLSGFESLHGSVTTAGAQWNDGSHWQAGVQFADAHNVELTQGVTDPAQIISANSLYAAGAWQDGGTRIQANLLDSDADQGRHGVGIWLDGETRQDRYRNNYGGFRLDPDLFWGYQQVASDLQGAYYRLSYQDQRWQWDGGVDVVDSVSGKSPKGTYATGNLRYQIDRTSAVGGGATVRHSGNNDWSSFVFAEKQTPWGSSRVQIDTTYEAGPQRSTTLTFDQTWPVPEGMRLSTSLVVGRETVSGDNLNTTSLSIYGGGDLTSSLSLEGTVRVSNTRDSVSGTGANADINLNWRINSRWSLVASYFDNRDPIPVPLTIDPLIPMTPVTTIVQSRALFLTLRYEDHAGTLASPLGGKAGGAAGTIAGVLFLDQNDTGHRSASDPGAPNVTVILDGLYPARTDAQGRFEFPLVAAGKHVLTVVPDNLPLPWYVGDGGKVEIVVRTRETSSIDIAASKRR
jgi:hypothetical protein